MIGVPLELDHAAVAILGHEAATGRALAAHRREVGGNARHDVVGRHDVGDELLGNVAHQLVDVVAASTGGDRGPGAGDDLEERPAGKPTHARLRGRLTVRGGRLRRRECGGAGVGAKTASSPTIYARALLARHRAG
jgi:hypothetical protein